jgi:hypothetical protein
MLAHVAPLRNSATSDYAFPAGTSTVIDTILLKFGRAPNHPAESIPATPVVVFVGPNNSGKSKILRELEVFSRTGQPDHTAVLLDRVTLSPLTAADADAAVTQFTLPATPGELQPGYIVTGKRGARNQFPRERLVSALQAPAGDLPFVCQYYLAFHTLTLGGANRITLVNSQSAGDLQKPGETALQVLFRDHGKRAEVHRIVQEAFHSHLVIDPTNLGSLRFRLSDRPPHDVIEEQGIHPAAVRFHSQAIAVEEMSDGVKAFTGIISEIIAGEPMVVLIDEPEAFLHPSLAFKLGKEIAISASRANKRLFISTHSSSFLMGVIHSGVAVTIVRLTYRGSVATARLLRNTELLRLMRNPLLRSTGVLSALFYEFVVVTEGDADRAFYQEINERLLRFDPLNGIPNCLFINAQNKQTVQTILRPLRELGIPAAGIVDIDVIKDGGMVWTGFLDGGFMPPLEHQSLGAIRHALKQRFDGSGRDMKRDGGIDILAGQDREAATNLFDRLEDYGLFVVRRGELEQWLSPLGAAGHGPAWLVSVFQLMGEDPNNHQYVRPQRGDVWEFIGRLKAWLTMPRRGIPV